MKKRDDNEHIEEDDIEIEETEEGKQSSGATAEKRIKKLKQKLKKCREEKEEYLDKWQRQKADFINARRRDEEDKQRAISLASSKVIEDLIPVIDSFNMAFSDKEAWEQTPENWRTGVEHIYSQLQAVLTEHNVTEVDPHGEPFDPQYHEAVDQVPVENEDQDNTVVGVLQKGYVMGETVLRPAKVRVGVSARESAGTGEEAADS